jgi:hypothetical protein
MQHPPSDRVRLAADAAGRTERYYTNGWRGQQDMAVEGTAKLVQTTTGLIGILGGLLSAVAAFDAQIRSAFVVFEHPGPVGLILLGAVLLALGLTLFLLSRRKASQLIDPDALRLDPRRPEHLIGRGDDVRLVQEKCMARPFVFLVGDSGAGKSALVRAGLMPALQTEGRLLTIYIDMANFDWDGGASEALADRFWRSLSASDREALNAVGPPTLADLPRLLATCYPTRGRTPLVILDQIHDYQLRHRERFLPPANKSWISAAELIRTNSFWGLIAPLVQARCIHVLAITRSDNADGLESLRLVTDPIVARLDPLPAGFVLRIIDQLTTRPAGAPSVIEKPEAGWDRLRLRLAQDLERGGAVLPQQLKVTLHSATGNQSEAAGRIISRPPGSNAARFTRAPCPPSPYRQGRASRIILNGVSVARRILVKPPAVMTSRSLASPACAPSADPTSCDSEVGTQIIVEAA